MAQLGCCIACLRMSVLHAMMWLPPAPSGDADGKLGRNEGSQIAVEIHLVRWRVKLASRRCPLLLMHLLKPWGCWLECDDAVLAVRKSVISLREKARRHRRGLTVQGLQLLLD